MFGAWHRPIVCAGHSRIFDVHLRGERTVPRNVLYVRQFHLYRNLTRTHAPSQIS